MSANKFNWKPGDVTVTEPQCFTCKHLNRENPAESTCTAFPKGIPLPILANKHDHRTAYPDDRGIRYERI